MKNNVSLKTLKKNLVGQTIYAEAKLYRFNGQNCEQIIKINKGVVLDIINYTIVEDKMCGNDYAEFTIVTDFDNDVRARVLNNGVYTYCDLVGDWEDDLCIRTNYFFANAKLMDNKNFYADGIESWINNVENTYLNGGNVWNNAAAGEISDYYDGEGDF